MRSKFFLGFLLVATLAFWCAYPTYSLTGREWPPCSGPLVRAKDCSNLHGPVHTVEFWVSSTAPKLGHFIYTFRKDGRMIGWGEWVNGVLKLGHRYQERDGGITVVDDDIDNSRVHDEDVLSLNKQGEIVSRKSRVIGGPFTVYYERTVDSTGRKVSELHCLQDGTNCRHTETESKYDAKGRLTFTREIDVTSGRASGHTEYEYPAENRKRTLDFGWCRDPNTPASVPTYIIETTYDSVGRVIEETTSAPGRADFYCGDGAPLPGRVMRQYDDQGNLVDETHDTDRGRNEHTSYSYEYDRFGNWTSKTSYKVDKNGGRGKPESVEYQKLTYYPR